MLSFSSPGVQRSTAVAAVLFACASVALAVSPNPRREGPPGGIAARSIELSAAAPSITLPASDGTSFELTRALERGPVVVVFFRGHW